MTLADLITQPISYESARDLAIVLTADQAATLGAIQTEHGNPLHVAAPVLLADGRLMLCADLLTEIGHGGLYSQGFAHLPTELFAQVAVVPMAEINLKHPHEIEESEEQELTLTQST
jgi:hypothetical protein